MLPRARQELPTADTRHTISPGRRAARGGGARDDALAQASHPAPSSETEGAAWVESDVPWRARWAGLPAYEGTTDSAGRPHGRGRLRLDEDGAWYEGRFWRGVRQGRGTLHFPVDVDGDSDADSDADPDASDPRFPSGGDRVTGTFADDTVEGWATYHCADGSSREGIWRDGELSGLVRERDPTGRVVFEGRYVAGARDGDGWIQHPDGGVLACAFEDGDVVPGRAVYTCPDAYGVPARGAIRTTRFQTPASARAAIDALGESRALFGNFDAAAREVAHPVRVAFLGRRHSRARERERIRIDTRRRGRSEGQRVGRVVMQRLDDDDDDDDGEEWVGPSRVCRLVAGECSEPLESATLASIRDESGDGDAIGEVRVRGDVIVPAGLVAFVHGERRAGGGGDFRSGGVLGMGARPTVGDVRARVRVRVRRRRWAVGVPTVNARFIFARTTTIPRMNTTRTVANRRSAAAALAVFSLRRGSVLGGVPSSNRGVRGDSRALRRARPADVPSRKVSTPAPRRDVGARRGASPRRRRGR